MCLFRAGHPGKGNSQCKGPGVSERSLACLEKSETVNEARMGAQGKGAQMRSEIMAPSLQQDGSRAKS